MVVATHAATRLYVEGLVAELRTEFDSVEVLTFFNGPLLNDRSIHALTSRGSTVTQYSPRTHPARLRDFRSAFRHMKARMLAADTTDVFMANPNEALTNWLAFFPESRERYRATLHLIPDGAANFYRTSVTEYDKRSLLYRLGCRLAGVPFHANDRTVLALDTVPYRDYWYCGSPGIMADFLPVRRFAVTRPAPVREKDAERWLFLGQPRMGDSFDQAYRAILSTVLECAEGRVDYKPHPHEDLGAERVRRLTDAGFTLQLGDASGERLSLSYGAVAGVLSSVLFNVRMLGWQDHAWGVLDHDLLNQVTGRPLAEVTQLAQAARKAGISPLRVQVHG